MIGIKAALIQLCRSSAGLQLARVALGLWFLGGGCAFAAEVIQTFDSEVRVARDGELSVTETLRVQAEGRDIRHGIYRDFPLTFKDADGVLREVDFKLLGVERDGKAETYSTTRQHGILRIYAGNKDTNVSYGEHTYVFRYRTGRQVRWFDGKPELNWNVTGNFWNFPILAATYRLQFVAGGAPVRWTAFTGRVGARGTDWRGSLGALGTLTVETTRRLAPGEGLTVVAEIPASAVDPPNANKLLWYEIFDNRQWIFGGIGLALVLIYYLAAWMAVGRDPSGGTIIPLFYPPKGISPALANYIHKWGLGREKWRAFTAAALSLAVRGLLNFDDRGGSLTLKATGKQPPEGFGGLPAGEGAIMTWVRDQGGAATISSAHGYAVEKVGEAFTKSIETANRNRFFRRNLGYVVAGLALTAAAIFASSHSAACTIRTFPFSPPLASADLFSASSRCSFCQFCSAGSHWLLCFVACCLWPFSPCSSRFRRPSFRSCFQTASGTRCRLCGLISRTIHSRLCW